MRKQVATLLTVAFLISISLTANAAIKPGTLCKKLGYTSISSGKQYTCVKSGKKLVWNKGVIIKSPTPIPTQTISPTSSTKPSPTISPTPALTPNYNNSIFASADDCKLRYINRNLSDDGPDDIGFPNESTLLGKSIIRTLGLFVEFKDAKGDLETMKSGRGIADSVSRFYELNSYGRVNFQWSFSSKYYTLPHATTYYHFFPGQWLKTMDDQTHYLQDAIDASDPDYDFRQFDLVILFPAKSASVNMPSFAYPGTHSGFFWKIMSKEGQIRNMQSVMASDFNKSDAIDVSEFSQSSWVNIAHEIGHEFLIPDLYQYGAGATFNKYMGIYDIMTGFFEVGAGIELSGWNRWLVDFLKDNEIICITNNLESTIKLLPIESQSTGQKLAIIPLDSTRAIVMESRRNLGFDSNLDIKSQGVLVFLIDTAIANGNGPLRLLIPLTSVDKKNLSDAALKPGQSLQFEKYTIKNLFSGPMGDYIKILKSYIET